MFKASCLVDSIAFALLAGCASPASPDESHSSDSDLVAPAPVPVAGSYVATSDWTPGSLVGLTLGDDHHYEATFRFASACAPADCDPSGLVMTARWFRLRKPFSLVPLLPTNETSRTRCDLSSYCAPMLYC